MNGSQGPTAARAILMISPPRPDGPILRYGKPYAAIAKLSPDIRAFIAMAEGLRSQGYSAPESDRLQHRGGARADRGFRRPKRSLKTAFPTARATSRRLRCLSICTGANCPTPCRSAARSTSCRPTISRRCWSRSNSRSTGTPPRSRGSRCLRARACSSSPYGGSSCRRSSASERPGRCATTIRRTSIGSRSGKASRGSASSIFRTPSSGRRLTISHRFCRMRASTCPTISRCGCAALYVRRRAAADPGFDAESFAAAYAATGAQRATKILGIFARLDKRDGKPQYLRHLPRIERYLAKNLAHPLLRPLALWYQNHLPRALGQPPEGPTPQDPRSDRP